MISVSANALPCPFSPMLSSRPKGSRPRPRVQDEDQGIDWGPISRLFKHEI